MRILMIGYNFSPEPTGIGKYSGEMLEWLARQGHDCTVITAFPYYPYWKVQAPYTNSCSWYKSEVQFFAGGGRLKVCRCPMYIPAKPTGIKRVLLDLSFFLSAFMQLLYLLPGKKFDLVITVVPAFHIGLLGIFYRKLRNAMLFYHIQDLQIEAARDLKMIRSKWLINMLFSLEAYILKQADVVSSISDGMLQKIKQKSEKEVFLFPNWVDMRFFYPISEKDSVKQCFGFSASDKIILYAGAIGEKQGLEAILYAAKEMQDHPQIKFVICGSGPYQEQLKKLSASLLLQNLVFLPIQPIEKFNMLLNAADVHLVVQKIQACDLVMPSKLSTILAVGGLAMVTANEGSGLYSMLKKHKIAYLVEAENQHAFNEGIRNLVSKQNTELKKSARVYAENFLSIDKIMKAFDACIRELVPQAVDVLEPETPLFTYSNALINNELAKSSPDISHAKESSISKGKPVPVQ